MFYVLWDIVQRVEADCRDILHFLLLCCFDRTKEMLFNLVSDTSYVEPKGKSFSRCECGMPIHAQFGKSTRM